MAVNRIRNLRPTFFEEEDICRASMRARLFFSGMWCRMDRNGLVEHKPQLLRSEILPWDDDVNNSDVEGFIEELCRHETPDGVTYIPMLVKVKYGKKSLLWYPNFKNDQSPHKTEKHLFKIDTERMRYVVENIIERSMSKDDAHEFARAQQGELSAQPENIQSSTGLYGLWVQVLGLWVMC